MVMLVGVELDFVLLVQDFCSGHHRHCLYDCRGNNFHLPTQNTVAYTVFLAYCSTLSTTTTLHKPWWDCEKWALVTFSNTCIESLSMSMAIKAIEVGSVYLVSKSELKPAWKNFNHFKNEVELVLDLASTVEHYPDEIVLYLGNNSIQTC